MYTNESTSINNIIVVVVVVVVVEISSNITFLNPDADPHPPYSTHNLCLMKPNIEEGAGEGGEGKEK